MREDSRCSWGKDFVNPEPLAGLRFLVTKVQIDNSSATKEAIIVVAGGDPSVRFVLVQRREVVKRLGNRILRNGARLKWHQSVARNNGFT